MFPKIGKILVRKHACDGDGFAKKCQMAPLYFIYLCVLPVLTVTIIAFKYSALAPVGFSVASFVVCTVVWDFYNR